MNFVDKMFLEIANGTRPIVSIYMEKTISHT